MSEIVCLLLPLFHWVDLPGLQTQLLMPSVYAGPEFRPGGQSLVRFVVGSEKAVKLYPVPFQVPGVVLYMISRGNVVLVQYQHVLYALCGYR
jgi:hypothetical protein